MWKGALLQQKINGSKRLRHPKRNLFDGRVAIMKILLTGGSGFIGSHVADALSEAGHEVVIYDLTHSPFLQPSQSMIIGDIMNPVVISAAMRGVDVVYHLAGIPHLDIGIREPIKTVELNILATVYLLEAARQAGVRRFIYSSSTYVYSSGGSFYRCSKQAAELYIEEYQRLHGLDYSILRFGTVYGPRADDHNSVRRYLKMALFDRRIATKATGDEVREYVHVRDAAKLCVRILEEQFRNQHIVLTGRTPMHLSELFKMIREIVGQDVSIETTPPDKSDPRHGISGHYIMTPFAFRPKPAMKLVNNPFEEMGQGLIECMEEIYLNKANSHQ